MWYSSAVARVPNENGSSRLHLRPSAEVEAYLDALARIGVHGKTRSEVAKTLVGNAIVELINSGFISQRPGAPSRPRAAKKR